MKPNGDDPGMSGEPPVWLFGLILVLALISTAGAAYRAVATADGLLERLSWGSGSFVCGYFVLHAVGAIRAGRAEND